MLEIYKVLPVDRVQQRFRSRFPSFPIQVAAVKIFSQSRAPQCLPRILLDKLVKRFLALLTGRKKVQRSRAPRSRNWVPSRAHGRRELSWVRLLLLVAEKQEWCFLVCSSGSPSCPDLWSSCWCRLCLATSPSWRLLEEFPLLRALLPRYSHLEIWTSPSPLYLFVLRCLGVASGVRCIWDACFTWFNSGYMFYERLLANFTYFLRVVNSDPMRLLSILAEWRSVHS